MKKFLIATLILPLFLYAQENQYSGIYNPKNKLELVTDLEDSYSNLLNKYEGDYRSKIKKQYKERNKTIKDYIKDSVFVFNKEYAVFLNDVLKEIKTSNPSINTENKHFLFNRFSTPNAACFGNGFFMFNTGLFQFLENEDELAFIVCHELAHELLDHVNNGIKRHVYTLNSKETKKKIKEVKLTIFGRNKRGMELLKELSFNFMKHSRKMELQADSLGVVLFNNTKYNPAAALSSLQKLKGSDEALFDTKIELAKFFNFKEYPFKSFWLEEEETIFDIKEKVDDYEINKDSLKSHPNIEDRIKAIQPQVVNKPFIDSKRYTQIQAFSNAQQIETLLDFNQVDFSLYFLLKRIQNQKANEMDYVQLAKTLKKIYELKLGHKLGKSVPQTSPFTEEKNLNEIRLFLHNLELKEVRKLGYFYCLNKEPKSNNNKEFKNVQDYFKTLNNKKQ